MSCVCPSVHTAHSYEELLHAPQLVLASHSRSLVDDVTKCPCSKYMWGFGGKRQV